jgi:hypothetical protein
MRAVIISEIDSSFKKLVWVEECTGGIYFGFYGKAQEIHYSYHQDGNVHIKQGSEYLPTYKTVAINDIDKFVNITNYGIPLEKGYEFAMSDYLKSKDSTAVIYINPEIIKRKKILNINAYIVRKGAEKDCIYGLQKSYQSLTGQSFEVLNANFFKLDIFKNFLAGIILSGGK